MKAKECMIAFNPNSDEIQVGPWPDRERWSRRYRYTLGGCYSRVQAMDHDQLVAYLFIEAMHIIIRDKVNSSAVHNVFCRIDEYRDGLAEDVPK